MTILLLTTVKIRVMLIIEATISRVFTLCHILCYGLYKHHLIGSPNKFLSLV